MAVTRSYDSQRLYVRVRNAQSNVKQSARPVANLFSIPYKQLKSQAKEIVCPFLNFFHINFYALTLLT